MSSPTATAESWMHAGRDVGTDPHPIPAADGFVLTSAAIPMQDGTRLRGDLHLPAGPGPFPAVIEVTPYGAQGLARLGRIYASRGFLFLAVDARGRYRSEGQWDPLTHDQSDGHAVIDWMAEHPLCNGLVGTRGHSYSGYNQLLAAIDAPPSLHAMVVGVAPGDPFDNVPFQGGAYDLNDLFWLLEMTGRTCPERDDEADQGAAEAERKTLTDTALATPPFGDADLRLGLFHETFRTWIAHWRLDEFWSQRSVGPRLDRTAVPTLHISGWWDGNGAGAVKFFDGMRRRAGTAHAREHQRLLLGPWNHDLHAPDTSALPRDESVAIERGALRDSLNDELAWFDQHLRGLPAGASGAARVVLFVTGLNRWLDLADWPVPGAEASSLYLARREDGGTLAEVPSATTATFSYRFDPDDPTPYADASVDGERQPFDAAELQASRKDLLIFDSEPLASPRLAIGPVSAVLHAAATTPDFDLCVSLFDVHPDGRSIYLTDGILRARFGAGFDRPQPVPVDEVREYMIDLWHVGHLFRAGHSIRVQVASAAWPKFDINPCTGGDLAAGTVRRVAAIRIVQGPGHPSRIVLPVAPSSLLDRSASAP